MGSWMANYKATVSLLDWLSSLIEKNLQTGETGERLLSSFGCTNEAHACIERNYNDKKYQMPHAFRIQKYDIKIRRTRAMYQVVDQFTGSLFRS